MFEFGLPESLWLSILPTESVSFARFRRIALRFFWMRLTPFLKGRRIPIGKASGRFSMPAMNAVQQFRVRGALRLTERLRCFLLRKQLPASGTCQIR